jgi:hypothetical protein
MTKAKRQRATLSAWEERYLELGKAVWVHYRERCHQAVESAIRWGHMKALPDGETQCSYCKTTPAMAWEHRDYTDPLNVVPACDRCNHSLEPSALRIRTVLLHLDNIGAECPYGPQADSKPEWEIRQPKGSWPEWAIQELVGKPQ